MATVGRYAAPSGLGWCITGDTSDAVGTTAPVVVSGQAVTVHPMWVSGYVTFQVQTRTRRRLSPATAATTNPAGGEVWEDWGAWQGTTDDGKVAAVTKADSYTYLTDGITVPASHAAYDAVDIEFRVRVHNQPDFVSSEWATGTIRARYAPKAVAVTVSPTSDGGADLAVDTDWARGGCTMRLGPFYRATKPHYDALAPAVTSTVGPDFSIHVPPAAVSGGAILAGNADLTTADGVRESRYTFATAWDDATGDYRFTVGEHQDATSVPEPTITAHDSGGDLVITVAPKSGRYDSVVAAISWTDADRTEYRETVELTESGGAWSTVSASPPLNTDIKITANCILDGEWRTVETTDRVECVYGLLTWGSERVELRYDIKRSMGMAHSAETVDIAGRSLPVSRHGSMGGRTVSISATLWEGDQSPAELDALHAPHDWILRTPDGFRARVMVDSWSRSDADSRGAWSVSVSCTEVAP